jgi:hypothetical protein
MHRVDLHFALLSAATSPDRIGRPCEVILGCRVSHVVSISSLTLVYPNLRLSQDPNCSVTSVDGTTYAADLIIGKDTLLTLR